MLEPLRSHAQVSFRCGRIDREPCQQKRWSAVQRSTVMRRSALRYTVPQSERRLWRHRNPSWKKYGEGPAGGGREEPSCPAAEAYRKTGATDTPTEQISSFLPAPMSLWTVCPPGQMMHQKESGAAKYPGIKRQRPGIPAACIDSLRKKRIQPKYAHRQNYQAYSFFRCFTIRTRAPFCLLLYTGGLSPVKTECTLFSRDLQVICPLPPTGEPIPFAGHLPYPDPISLFPARPARPV